jgi:hypothetical protein
LIRPKAEFGEIKKVWHSGTVESGESNPSERPFGKICCNIFLMWLGFGQGPSQEVGFLMGEVPGYDGSGWKQ